LIVAVAIPFSLLVTCGAMLVTGFNFNVLTLLGLMLGVGMLVDNAVVVIENIYRLQRQGVPSVRAAREGARQVALAVTAATATTLIVWSWLFIAEKDQLTIYVGEVALVLCLAVSCSWLISLTFIPLAAARFVPHRELRPGFFETRLAPAYRKLMRRTMRARALTLTCLLGLAATAVIPFSLIEIQGNPREQTRDVAIYYRIYDQVTKEVAEGYVNRIEDWLDSRRDELGYEYVYSWYSETQGTQTRVYLPDEATNERAIERLRDQLQTGLPVIPGVEFELGDMRHHHHEPSRAATARVALHGEDPEYLEGLARDVEQRMRGLPDLVEVYGPSLEGRREARILVDAERARALDVTPRDVADVVAFWFRGQQLRRFEGPRGEVELIVGLPETAKPGLDSIPDLQIPRADREPITLGAVAEVVVTRTPPHIIRVDRKTTSHVTVEFDDDAVTTEEAQERVAQRMEGLELPEGYAWDWGQRRHREGDALATMGTGVVLSLILVLLLMAALFESFSQPLAILITLPLAFFGLVFEPVAFIGLIILIGIVVNNGIVMVEHVNALRRQGRSREDALIEGCGDRLRPVLMTAITTVVGLTPLALSKFTVAGVYIDSMAVGMIGGLLSSSLFTLLALPVWYTTVEDVGAILAGLLPRWWGRLAAGGVLTRTPR
jgi:HAE1 family hydrophobic/amphiphilic exporter-1